MKLSLQQNHESPSHKRTSHTARTRTRQRRRTEPIHFVCVDGEGQDFEDGSHRYVLLGIGNDQISNPNGLHHTEIFQFLYDHFEEGGTAYTGFFLSYDLTQWLRSLPEYKARRLLDSKERAKRKRRTGHNGRPLDHEIYFPVDIDGWEIDILGTKRFKLRPEGASRWMYICDTGSFFQKSFLSVINPSEWVNPIVSEEEYQEISAGKSRRSSAILDDSMRYYNKAENTILSRVLGELDNGFRELGINLSPKQWFGPGQAVQCWLDNQRCITSKELQECVPPWFLEASIASYFGGWFEIMSHGIIPGDSYEYDINSAYPYVISTLPCLKHGTYTRGTHLPEWWNQVSDNRRLSLVRTTVWANRSQEVPNTHNDYIGAMLHRDEKGNISRPLVTEGWYWLDELKAAQRAGIVAGWEMHEWVSYEPCNCDPPLAEIQAIYDLRLQVGKKTPLGMACKLVPNSAYGKFAQSVGNPKYGNPVYASRITSECRRMILDAISTHPKGKSDVLMVATDGVYFRSPHPYLSRGTNLGQWDQGTKSNLCLFKPGVYWDDKARQSIRDGSAPVFKARGVNAKYFAGQIQAIDDQFTQIMANRPRQILWPEVSFNLDFSMVTAVQALARGNWLLAGKINHDVATTQSSDPSQKREGWYYDRDILRSRPPKNLPFEISHSYTKRFGLDDPWSEESTTILGETQDGKATDLWKEVLSS